MVRLSGDQAYVGPPQTYGPISTSGRLYRPSGTLEIDGAGGPTGDVAVRAENWRQIIALGVNAGLVPPAMQGTLEPGLSVIANLSGRAQDVDVTLSFADGRAYLGPIPLGPSPYFYLY